MTDADHIAALQRIISTTFHLCGSRHESTFGIVILHEFPDDMNREQFLGPTWSGDRKGATRDERQKVLMGLIGTKRAATAPDDADLRPGPSNRLVQTPHPWPLRRDDPDGGAT